MNAIVLVDLIIPHSRCVFLDYNIGCFMYFKRKFLLILICLFQIIYNFKLLNFCILFETEFFTILCVWVCVRACVRVCVCVCERVYTRHVLTVKSEIMDRDKDLI